MTARPFTVRESLVALLAALALAALVLAPALFGERNMLAFPVSDPRVDIRPWVRAAAPGALPDVNLATPDVVGYVLPGLVRTRQLLAAGGAAAWDDAQLLGVPFAANGYFPVPSPLEWVTRPFDPVTALDLLLALHVACALWLAYRAARLLDTAPPFAALAALGFTFSAWMITRWHCPPMTWASTWFPLQLSALAWMRRGRGARALLEFGAATALGLLSGFAQSVLLLGGAAALLALLDPALRRPRALGTLALGGLAGVAIALPALLPALKLTGASLRAEPAARHALAESRVPPAALAGLLLPELFGDPVAFGREHAPAPTMEAWLPQRLLLESRLQTNVAELAGYVGVLLLLLVPCAARAAAGSDARRLLLVALVGLAAAVLAPHLLTLSPAMEKLALGNSKRFLAVWCACLPFAGALAAQAVLAGRVRLPLVWGGLLLAATLLAPWLASRLDDPQAGAFSADLRRQALRQAPLIVGSLIALALTRRGIRRAAGTARARHGITAHAGTALAGASGRDVGHAEATPAWTACAWVPALLLGADLIACACGFNPSVPDEPLLPPTATVSALAPLAASATHAPGDAPVGRVAVFGEGQNLLPGTFAAATGLRVVGGCAALTPTRTAELLGCLEGPLFDADDPRIARPLRDVATLHHALLDLLCVTAVVHADPTLAARSGLPVLFEAPDEGLAGLARPSAGPPAFLCGGARVVPDRDARLAWLARPDAPVFETVLLESAPPFPLPERRAAGPLRADVSISREQPEAFVVRCRADEPAVLLVSEAWDPGWSAQLDGVPCEVPRVDHALLGAFVPPGSHELRFTYATPGAGMARGLSLAGLVVLLVAALRARRTSSAGPSATVRRRPIA